MLKYKLITKYHNICEKYLLLLEECYNSIDNYKYYLVFNKIRNGFAMVTLLYLITENKDIMKI